MKVTFFVDVKLKTWRRITSKSNFLKVAAGWKKVKKLEGRQDHVSESQPSESSAGFGLRVTGPSTE